MSKTHRYTIEDDVDLDTEPVILPDGSRLTSDRAEQIAEREHRRARGRPSLAHGRSPRVSFRVTPHLHEQAEALASRRGVPVSQIARDALTEYVDTEQ